MQSGGCGPQHLGDIGKADTSAGYPPRPCAAANDPRASARRGALAWPVQSIQSQSPQRRGHAFELVNVSKAHPTDRDRRHRSDRCKLGRVLPFTWIRRRRHRSGANAEPNLRKYRRGRLVRGSPRPGWWWPALPANRLTFTPSMGRALAEPDFVQENAPERPEFKDRSCSPKWTKLRRRPRGPRVELVRHSHGRHPDRRQASRALRHRPPVQSAPHRSPRRSVGGAKTSEAVIERAMSFYASIGKKPIRLRKSLPAMRPTAFRRALQGDPLSHPARRAQRGGCGHRGQLRSGAPLGVMGQSLQWHLGGGAGGIHHFMEHLMRPRAA